MPVRRRITVLVAVLVAAYAIFALVGPQGVFTLRERFKEVRALQQEVATLESETRQKRGELESLSREEVKQQEVQKELNKFKPGTKEFVLPKLPDGTPEPAPAPADPPRE